MIGVIASSIPLSSFDADALAFITAAGLTNTTQKSAINTLVLDLKTKGLWTKMTAIYPFVGGTASTHKWNLKDPRDLDAAFRLSFIGTWSHSSTGALPNGVAPTHADTFLIPNGLLGQFSSCIGIYLGTNNNALTSDPVDIGNNINELIVSKATLYGRLNNITTSFTSQPTRAGHKTISRISSTDLTMYNNGSLFTTNTSTASLILSNSRIWIAALNYIGGYGYTNNEFRIAYISQGLNSTEVSSLHTIVQAYQTTLGRAV